MVNEWRSSDEARGEEPLFFSLIPILWRPETCALLSLQSGLSSACLPERVSRPGLAQLYPDQLLSQQNTTK